MFCENCGKSIIRGYNFCLECGTPVPPENVEAEQAEDNQSMPQIEPLSNEGTLVFCPSCGMHMQTSTAYCEKCGQQLQANNPTNGDYSNLPKNGSVPLWNTDSVDYGYETMTEGEIEQINNFMNGGGLSEAAGYEDYQEIGTENAFNGIGGADGSSMPDIGGGVAEIEAITAQFASMANAAAAADYQMPAIGAQDNMIHDDIVKVDNFAMDTSYVDDEYVDEGSLPVIEGASMEYDPDEPEPEDPNAFVMTDSPVTLASTYEESAVEDIPAYEEPVVEDVPAYEEPVVEDIPAYEEPVVEDVPAYEEPVVEDIPAYEEPAAEEAYAIPLYGSDDSATDYAQNEEPEYSSDIPLFGAAEDVPTYEEAPTFEESEETTDFSLPTYEEPAVEDVPAYEEETAEDDNIGAAIGVAALGAAAMMSAANDDNSSDFSDPVQSESYSEPVSDYSSSDSYNTYSSSYSAPAPVAEVSEEPAVDLGKLVYCRNCGQDMYELETVCKYCGSPKREPYKPRNVSNGGKAKGEPFKLFGIFSIPAIIVTVVVIIGLCLLIIPSLNKNDIVESSKPSTSSTSGISGNEQLNATTPADDDDDSSVPAATDTSATTADTTPEESVPDDTTPVEIETNEPVVTESTPASEPVEPQESTPATTTTPKVTSTPKVTTTTPKVTTTPKTTTTRPVVTTPSAGAAYVPSATIKSQNKERDKMIEAYELIAEEIGKVDLLARSTSYAINFDSRNADTAGKSFYSRDFAAALLKNIKNSKSSVTTAVASAKPTTAELNTAYKALCKLQDKYVEYYNYVVNATSFGNYESKCDSYMSSFSSYAASNFSLSAMNTSAQNATDKAEYYASVVSNAVAAAENASAAYSTLRTKVSGLTAATFEGQFLTVMNDNMATYLKAVKYTQAVASYCDILSSAPSAYSSAYTAIKTARDNLNTLSDTFAIAQYDNTLDNFKSSTNTNINAVNGSAAKAKNSL